MVDAATSLARAATLLDESAALARSAVRPRLGRLFDRGAGEPQLLRALSQAELAVQELRRGGARASQAADGVASLVAEYRQNIAATSFAHHRSNGTFVPASGRFRILAERMRLLEQVAPLDDAAARGRFQVLLDEVGDRIVASPTDADRRTIAALRGLPAEVRPRLVTASDEREWVRAATTHRQWALRAHEGMRGELQAHAQRRAIAATPGVTRETLAVEFDELLRRDPTTLGYDELRRISLLAGMDDSLRPPLADIALPYPLYHPERFAGEISDRGAGMVMRGNIEAMRMERELLERQAAGTLPTREAAIEELVELLGASGVSVDAASLRRISQLTRLPGELRPPTVPQSTSLALEHVGAMELRGYHDGLDLARLLDDARDFFAVLRDPATSARAARTRIDAGETIDLVRLTALQHAPDELVAAGITEAMIGDQLARHLLRAGDPGMTSRTLSSTLETARARMAALDLPDEVEPLRGQALELVDRNLARMAGHRSDTYGWHPDYAEVGRVASLAQLLDAAATVHAPRPTASTGAELLPW